MFELLGDSLIFPILDNLTSLLVPRPQRGVPIPVAIADHFDLPRLAADRAILYVDLAGSTDVIDVELHRLATVRTVR